MSGELTGQQLGYIRWLTWHVGCPIPMPELLSVEEASWLIWGLRQKLYQKRKYFLIR